MSHDGTGIGWDETCPVASIDANSAGAQEIRDLRKGVNLRLLKEHIEAAPSEVGGEHLAGSAKCFFDDNATITLRPDGETSLESTDDDGRLLVDDGSDEGQEGSLYYWEDDQWNLIQVPTGSIVNLAVTTGKIALQAVEAAQIKLATITVAQLANNAVESAIIKDANVTHAKLADNAVEGHNVLDATLTLAKMATDVISRVAVGTYIGKGKTQAGDCQTVTTINGGKTNSGTAIGFDPTIILIMPDWAFGAYLKTSTMDTDEAKDLSGLVALVTSLGTISLTTGGFIVGSRSATTTTQLTVLDKVYHFIAIRIN